MSVTEFFPEVGTLVVVKRGTPALEPNHVVFDTVGTVIGYESRGEAIVRWKDKRLTSTWKINVRHLERPIGW